MQPTHVPSACKCGDAMTKPCKFTRGELITLLKEATVDGRTLRDTDTYSAYFESLVCPGKLKPRDHCTDCSQTIAKHDAAPPSDAHEQLKMLTIAHATTLIPRPTSSKTKPDRNFRNRVVEFYNTKQCVFLAKRFPGTVRASKRENVTSCFPCIGAHIYDHRMQDGAKSLGLDLNDARNGLPLFKSIEERFDEGRIAIVPIDVQDSDINTTTLRILVCNELKDQEITVHQGKGKDKKISYLRTCRGRRIKYGDIHETEVVLPSPFLRSLMLKQQMSYLEHPEEFPAPDLTLFEKITSPQKSKEAVQMWMESLQPPTLEKRQREPQDDNPPKRRKNNSAKCGSNKRVWVYEAQTIKSNFFHTKHDLLTPYFFKIFAITRLPRCSMIMFRRGKG